MLFEFILAVHVFKKSKKLGRGIGGWCLVDPSFPDFLMIFFNLTRHLTQSLLTSSMDTTAILSSRVDLHIPETNVLINILCT